VCTVAAPRPFGTKFGIAHLDLRLTARVVDVRPIRASLGETKDMSIVRGNVVQSLCLVYLLAACGGSPSGGPMVEGSPRPSPAAAPAATVQRGHGPLELFSTDTTIVGCRPTTSAPFLDRFFLETECRAPLAEAVQANCVGFHDLASPAVNAVFGSFDVAGLRRCLGQVGAFSRVEEDGDFVRMYTARGEVRELYVTPAVIAFAPETDLRAEIAASPKLDSNGSLSTLVRDIPSGTEWLAGFGDHSSPVLGVPSRAFRLLSTAAKTNLRIEFDDAPTAERGRAALSALPGQAVAPHLAQTELGMLLSLLQATISEAHVQTDGATVVARWETSSRN
jgi:hypothetical protein